MSVYKCHAFIFLDQPPPWPSRTAAMGLHWEAGGVGPPPGWRTGNGCQPGNGGCSKTFKGKKPFYLTCLKTYTSNRWSTLLSADLIQHYGYGDQQLLHFCTSALPVCGKLICSNMSLSCNFLYWTVNFRTQHPLASGYTENNTLGCLLITKGVVINFRGLMFFCHRLYIKCLLHHKIVYTARPFFYHDVLYSTQLNICRVQIIYSKPIVACLSHVFLFLNLPVKEKML